MKIGKSIERGLKNLATKILRAFLSQPLKIPSPPYRRILFLRYDVLGDMILSIPVFKTFRQQYPETQIDALCSTRNYILLEGTDLVDNIYIYERNPIQNFKLIRNLRKSRYDMIINLVTRSSFTFGLVARLSGPHAVRIAADQEQFDYFYNRIIDLPAKSEIHMLKRKFLLCGELIADRVEVTQKPWVSYNKDTKDKAKMLFNDIIEQLEIKTHQPHLAVINLSAGLTRREWPLEKYAQFLQKAIKKYHHKIDGWAIFSDPKKSGQAQKLFELVNNKKVAIIPFQTDFRVIMEFLRLIYVLITPDTSFVHAASAMGTPILDLMIGENINIWDPIEVPNHIILSEDPFNLRDLPVDKVLMGFDKLLTTL